MENLKQISNNDITEMGFKLKDYEGDINYSEANSPSFYVADTNSDEPIFLQRPDYNKLYLLYRGYNSRSVLFLSDTDGEDFLDNHITLFNGYIDNKSELETILKQVGYYYD